uniref:Anaphase-promoting complex subunit 11 RING-H2 finger domain-containing protein n=1 Tax=Megaselia scalaris TaxID=36166 RepID=T1G9Y0_MEGSC
MKVKIKSWTGVSTWRWNTNDDNCGICRSSFESTCPKCYFPGETCPIVWGFCKHCFHMHCIQSRINGTKRI